MLYHAPVRLYLFLPLATRTLGSATLTRQVRPRPRQPRKRVFQTGKLYLKYRLFRSGTLGKNVQNNFTAVDHRRLHQTLPVALLRWRQIRVEHQYVATPLMKQTGNLLRFAGVQATLSGMRPVIVGLILATAFTMILSVIFGIQSVGETEGTDWRAGAIFIILVLANLPSLLRKKRTLSPILCILLSAALGIAFYSF